MSVDRKTLLIYALVLLGWVFIFIGGSNPATPLGVLGAIGTWILIGLLVYDRYRTRKKYEQKHTQR